MSPCAAATARVQQRIPCVRRPGGGHHSSQPQFTCQFVRQRRASRTGHRGLWPVTRLNVASSHQDRLEARHRLVRKATERVDQLNTCAAGNRHDDGERRQCELVGRRRKQAAGKPAGAVEKDLAVAAHPAIAINPILAKRLARVIEDESTRHNSERPAGQSGAQAEIVILESAHLIDLVQTFERIPQLFADHRAEKEQTLRFVDQGLPRDVLNSLGNQLRAGTGMVGNRTDNAQPRVGCHRIHQAIQASGTQRCVAVEQQQEIRLSAARPLH